MGCKLRYIKEPSCWKLCKLGRYPTSSTVHGKGFKLFSVHDPTLTPCVPRKDQIEEQSHRPSCCLGYHWLAVSPADGYANLGCMVAHTSIYGGKRKVL